MEFFVALLLLTQMHFVLAAGFLAIVILYGVKVAIDMIAFLNATR